MTDERNLNLTDREFNVIRTFVQNSTEQEIVTFICENFLEWGKEIPGNVLNYILNFHKYYKFWGDLNTENGNVELIQQRASIIKNQWDKIEEFYEALSDFRSKDILIMILENWLSFSYEKIDKVKEHNFKSYFDLDLLKTDEEEVFVDLGAWQGDTIDDYILSYGENNYKKIYTYEILEENIKVLKEKFSDNERVVIRPVGVSNKKGIMYLSDTGTSGAEFLVKEGTKAIETVALDEDILEKITFLKMDIEGAERDAILGAKKHIKEDKPKLAISIYHSNEDLFYLFHLIKRIQPEYKFYLRYYGLSYFPTDYILICVPE